MFRSAVLACVLGLLFIDTGFGQRIIFVMDCFLQAGGKQTSCLGCGAEGKYGTKK
ncbi:MAG: hypothetical protein ACJ0BH_01570 [Candidatus Puniceispirillaceae bacterium]